MKICKISTVAYEPIVLFLSLSFEMRENCVSLKMAVVSSFTTFLLRMKLPDISQVWIMDSMTQELLDTQNANLPSWNVQHSKIPCYVCS